MKSLAPLGHEPPGQRDAMRMLGRGTLIPPRPAPASCWPTIAVAAVALMAIWGAMHMIYGG